MEIKTKRSGRATAEQYSVMLDYFQANKGLAEGKVIALHGKEAANKKWQELTSTLNSARGAQKTSVQWQSAWRDLKSRTSIKARERRKEMAATGGKPLSSTELSELELRVLDIIGMQYVEGSRNCADSIPEEESLQVSLEAGDCEVLYEIPTVPSMEEDLTDDPQPVEANAEYNASPAVKRKRSTFTPPRKRSIFESAREQFSTIAKQQADAMSMQAEAAKKQAEAALLQAQAFDRVATALEHLAYTIRPFIDAEFSRNEN